MATATPSNDNNKDQKFLSRVQSAIATVQAWDADPSLLAECRALIPLHVLMPEQFFHTADDDPLCLATGTPSSEYERDDDVHYEGNALLLKRLTLFFKTDVMTWVNAPPCGHCGCDPSEMKSVATRNAETMEEREGGANRVELYSCPKCPETTTTFPRYSSPRKLLETRRGRCGEFANLFGLYCRAVGFETRYVLDCTDHVWTEVYVGDRWIMADSCEGVIDRPSMYESGWGKKLSYIFGVSNDAVMDVTPRYTRQFSTSDFQARRREICSSEAQSQAIINKVNTEMMRGGLSKARVEELDRRAKVEHEMFGRFQKATEWTDGYKEGRTSGSLAWRASRQELGDGQQDKSESPPANVAGFHVESYFPHSEKGVTITVTSHPRRPHGGIVVSGVACAVDQPNSISVVVLDQEYVGCILQSRSFDSWANVGDFVNRLPKGRIIAVSGKAKAVCDSQAKANLSRLGGFVVPQDENVHVMFVGTVDYHPDWATYTTIDDSEGIQVIVQAPRKQEKPRLRTERNTMPRRVAGRLPESFMPLQTQLLATEEQKRLTFEALISKLDACDEGSRANVLGYTTKPKAAVYLLDETAYPFERTSEEETENNKGSWNTFHLLPAPLVPEDDKGIVEQESNIAGAKFDIPLDTSFFVSLLGPTLLSHTGGSSVLVDTPDALKNARLVALYFSAHWCGPCRQFTPMLAEMYAHLKEEVAPTHGLEMVFVSSDRDVAGFQQYFNSMPWLAVPYSHGRMLQQQISARFGVRGIPALFVLDAMTGQIVVDNSRETKMDIMRACQRGDQGIEDMFKNQWLAKIPQESQEITQMLALSCADEPDEAPSSSNTEEHPYFVRSTNSDKVPDPTVRIKEIFAKLVAEGTEPNAAAAKAIQLLAEEQKSSTATASLNAVPWKSVVFTSCVKHSADILPNQVTWFNDASHHGGDTKLTGLRVAHHPTDGTIVGLQSVYGDTAFGKKHFASAALEEGAEWSDVEASTGWVTRVIGKFGDDGLNDLVLVFDDQNNITKEGEFSLKVPEGSCLMGFYGTAGGNGFLSIGLVCSKAHKADSIVEAGMASDVELNSCADRWAAKVAQYNHDEKAAVRTVLSTAQKYLDNAIREPWTPKFRSFKLSNKIVDRITKVEGGLRLMSSLGFYVYGTQQDYMACVALAADLDQMHANLARVLDAYKED